MRKRMSNLAVLIFSPLRVAFRASVESRTEQSFMQIFKEQVYTLEVKEIFKGQSNVEINPLTNQVKIYAPSNGSSCAIWLQPGKEYVLLGRVLLMQGKPKLFHGFCDWHKEWADLTTEQLLGIQSLYGKGCICSIGFCFTPNCRNLLPGCDGYDYNVDQECRENYQRCARQISPRGEIKCAWIGRKMCSRRLFFP